jgi:hypothetical protein
MGNTVKSLLTILFACLTALPVVAGNKSTKAAGDPDDAYKNNCMRCHSAVRPYSLRMTATIVMHMRIRANMTAEESQAILQYLADSSPAKVTPPVASKQK